MRRIVPIALACLVVYGCDTVQLQYQTPAPASDFSAADRQALDHFEYVALNESYVLVSPASTTTPDKPEAPSDAGSNASQASAGAQQKQKKQTKAKAANAAKPAANDGANASTPASGDGSNAQVSPAQAPGPLTGVTIDNMKWIAQVVPIPSSEYGVAVKGISNFWKTTTIGVSKYPNSDLVSSVSSKAENLVPKRVGQIAAIVATAVKSTGVAVDSAPKLPLEPFSFAVSDTKRTGSVNPDWNYELTLDAPPPGTVSMRDFLKNVQGKTVNYWPVPACRSATLTLFHKSNGKRYAFHIIVSSPEHVRLQPLSVDGKTDLGTVCGASTTGSTTPDTFGALVDDFTAVQQAVASTEAPAADGASAPSGK